jgi:hypothetical protein
MPDPASQAVMAPPPPPPPPQPEVHEYKQAESDGGPARTFSIVSKDGTTRSAIAVWVQDDTVRYIAPDGDGGQLTLGSVNREATGRANAEKHLTLSLPANARPLTTSGEPPR